ncbi:VIT family protein [Microlunatus elymi]|uniref:VIT family protein n=2 Tax=Microlunatus elymi TaxID=2596828 RepID=A0A516Q1N6_9ACTN|nr:VIT family protein [Microlunatus elymi]QDP97347.1 VIT family protein [Microlunatus elymi]
MTETIPTAYDRREQATDSTRADQHPEPQGQGINQRLNWLRAGVLGANDGIVSTAGIVIGVAGASVGRGAIGLAGLAGLVAGALSMAAGEYVSVNTQRDTEKALIEQEKRELETMPEAELDELTEIYRRKGLSAPLARQVAQELTEHNALEAHLEAELKIDADDLSNPLTAALASALSFTVGALLPLLMIILTPESVRIPLTVVAVVIALVITGAVSARLGGAPAPRAVLRNVLGGLVAMAVTYLIGRLAGTL